MPITKCLTRFDFQKKTIPLDELCMGQLEEFEDHNLITNGLTIKCSGGTNIATLDLCQLTQIAMVLDIPFTKSNTATELLNLLTRVVIRKTSLMGEKFEVKVRLFEFSVTGSTIKEAERLFNETIDTFVAIGLQFWRDSHDEWVHRKILFAQTIKLVYSFSPNFKTTVATLPIDDLVAMADYRRKYNTVNDIQLYLLSLA